MKTMNDLRAMLCEEITKIRENKTTPANVNAITNATGKILATIKLELEYAKLSNMKPKNCGFIEMEDKAPHALPDPKPKK